MRSGVEVRLDPGDRERLEAVVGDRNSRQKHVWRAKIVLLTADGLGTNEIMRRTGKPCVAMAGAFHDRWCRRPAARQDPAAGQSADPRRGGRGDR